MAKHRLQLCYVYFLQDRQILIEMIDAHHTEKLTLFFGHNAFGMVIKVSD